MQGVRSSFLWHCVGLEQQFSKSFRFRSQFNKWKGAIPNCVRTPTAQSREELPKAT
jgi:hypothetical protein